MTSLSEVWSAGCRTGTSDESKDQIAKSKVPQQHTTVSIFANYGHMLYFWFAKITVMNVSLTEKQEQYITEQIRTGDYQNASELVRDALRLHQIYRHRIIEDLRNEIAKGWNSPASGLSATEIATKKLEDRQR